jgi:hypothetical protein
MKTAQRLKAVIRPAAVPTIPRHKQMSQPSPEELLSARFDGSPSAESSAPKTSQESELIQQWRHLGECLRDIPIQPCDQISTAVRSCIESSQPEVVPEGCSVSSESTRHQGSVRHIRSIIVVLTAVVAILIVTVPISLLVTQTDSIPVAAIPDSGGNLPYALAEESPILPANSQDWQVVVVTVSEQKHAEVSSKLRQSIGQSGLEIQSLSEADLNDDRTMGVLMSSADTSWELLDALDTGFNNGVAGDIQTEWNPQRIGNFDRDELLARLAESMKTPTQSDVYFGEMFVVVPTNGALVTEFSQLSPEGHSSDRDQSVDSIIASASSARSRADRTNPESTSERSEPVGGRPVLVLFQKKPAPEDSQGNHQQLHDRSQVSLLPLIG